MMRLSAVAIAARLAMIAWSGGGISIDHLLPRGRAAVPRSALAGLEPRVRLVDDVPSERPGTIGKRRSGVNRKPRESATANAIASLSRMVGSGHAPPYSLPRGLAFG